MRKYNAIQRRSEKLSSYSTYSENVSFGSSCTREKKTFLPRRNNALELCCTHGIFSFPFDAALICFPEHINEIRFGASAEVSFETFRHVISYNSM